MVSIALVDARKTSLTGVQNSRKIGSPLRGSDIAASRLVDDAPHRRWLKPPPWKKARSAPVTARYGTGPTYARHGANYIGPVVV